VEDFLHHGEALADLLEQGAHEFLPAPVYGVLFQLAPGAVKVVDTLA
jgi:hypothetical protein